MPLSTGNFQFWPTSTGPALVWVPGTLGGGKTISAPIYNQEQLKQFVATQLGNVPLSSLTMVYGTEQLQQVGANGKPPGYDILPAGMKVQEGAGTGAQRAWVAGSTDAANQGALDPYGPAGGQAPPEPKPAETPVEGAIKSQGERIDDAIADLGRRTAIETPKAATIGQVEGPQIPTFDTPIATPTAATVAGPTSTPTAARIGPIGGAGGGGIDIPTISLARPDTIEPYLAEHSQYGARQKNLADLLESEAFGKVESPEALNVRKEVEQQGAAQMSLASSAAPAARPAALRTAMQNTGRIQGAGAAEIAQRNQVYRDSARSQLMGLLDQARSGDISEAQFDAAAKNTAANLYAQLTSNTNIAEGNIKGQLASAGIGAQATLGAATINANTSAAIRQAELEQDAKMKAFDAEEHRNELNAQYEQAVRMFGAESAEARAIKQAELQAGAELARYTQESETNRSQASLQQQAEQFGADLQYRTRTAEDQQLISLLSQNKDMLQLLQTGQLTREQLNAEQLMKVQELANAWDIANLNSQTQIKLGKMNEPGFWDRFTAIVGPALGVAAAAVGKH